MKITICGSLKFVKEMKEVQNLLEEQGHVVLMPESAVEEKNDVYWNELKESNVDEFARVKGERIKLHFNKINSSDAILILNYDKHGKENYIGPNTFLEMGFAFGMNKKIFVLNDLPQDQKHEELLSMKPICLNQDFNKIREITCQQ